jgi:molybdenum cofactor cytidylyltransferase
VKIAAVVLAAGASRRLGRPKQTVILAGETLVERTVRIALEARLQPVIAVVRPEGDFGHSLQTMGAVVVLNDASIRYGVNVARLLKASGVVLLTCDQVAVTAEHLQALCAKPAEATGSGYAGKVGIPAYFPAANFDSLMQLTGDTGARDLLRHARSVSTEALAFDIDTEADVARARTLLED